MEVTTIERGWTVYTEDNKRVGDVVEVHPHYLLVSRGVLVVRDVYVPRYAVTAAEDRKVHLAITEERLRRMGWTSPPPEPPPPVDSVTPRLVPPVASPDTVPFSGDDGNEATTAIRDALQTETAREAEDGATASDPYDFGAMYDGADTYLDDYADLGVVFGPTIEVDGEAHLAVQRLGEGPPLVFIHGWGLDRRVWDYLTLDLPRDYTVVTYDARGYGGSTAPWDGYGVERASRDLRVILRTLDLQDATLVAVDSGARAALHYALNGGRRVARLVLIAPSAPVGNDVPAGLAEQVAAWRALLRRDRPRLAAELAALWAPGASPETRDWLRDGLMSAAPHVLWRGLDALTAPEMEGALDGITVPTHMLCGAQDPLIPLAHAQHLAGAIPGARLVVLDIPGHLPMIADPERVVAQIRAALITEHKDNTLT